MSDNSTILQVNDLSVVYDTPGGHLHALDSVSLSVRKGETLGLVGESGSGKSTLALAMMRAVLPTKGQVLFQGQDLTHLSEKTLKPLRRRMQMVFQDPYASLNPNMRVREIIAEPLRAHKWGTRTEVAERVRYLLNEVGLPQDAGDRLPAQFSGGQRQRIAIARALALEPDVLIADEPVSALDVSIQAQIINMLRDIQRDLGIAYVVVAHDLALVHQISHRIAVMYLGNIVEEGPADVVVATPVHPYTVSLLAATPMPELDVCRKPLVLRGEPPSAIDRPSGCAFHPRCPVAREICAHQTPRLTPDVDGRIVACHFPGELPSPVVGSGDLS